MKGSANTHFLASHEFDANSSINADVYSSVGTFELRRARYFSENGTPMLEAEQQRALTNLVEKVDPAVKHSMIVQNLRMVVSIAKRYTDRGLEFVDLVRAGNKGLMQAMEKFEPEVGYCFTTFLTWCISHQIELALMQHGNDSTLLQTQTDPVQLMSFHNALKKRTETCLEYPSGCSRKPG